MELISQIIGGLFGGGIVALLIAVIYRNMDSRVTNNTQDIKEFKENYLDRFDKVYHKVDKVQGSMGRLEISVTRIEEQLKNK